MNKKFQIIFILSFLFLIEGIYAQQDRFKTIEENIHALKSSTPGLEQKVDLSVNGIPLHEFIRALATSNNLNVSVDPGLTEKIYNNFSNAPVSDILLFLTKKYNLDVELVGNIMTFKEFKIQSPPPPKYAPKEIRITYIPEKDWVSMDVQNDSIQILAKSLTRHTGKNVLFSSELTNKTVSGYIQNQPFEKALDLLAFSNDLKVTKSGDQTFLLEKLDKNQIKNPSTTNKLKSSSGSQGFTLKVNDGKISISGINVPISEIINAVSNDLNLNYFLFSEIRGNASLSIEDATYEQFLAHLLNGTEYTFKNINNIYLLGDRKLEGLRATRVIQLQNRSAAKVEELIPTELKTGVDIKPFPDLNSVILSGSNPRIIEIESFIRDIDRVVPVVAIDVMIMDVNDSKTLSTGIEAGLKSPGTTQTTGEVHPGIDLNISTESINDIITGINGLGLINLGKVTPNFYFKLKALETQGIVKINSTPKLAALNGHLASMAIGKTEYYREESNNVLQGINPQLVVTRQYKSVNADLSVTIEPVVSGDEQITLQITVKQSTFTSRFEPNAPPGTVTREFKSMIRVKNDEMIMLGGLDENSSSETGRGLPLLQRVPVLKWIFSSRNKTKTKSRLTIFIKPTVLY